MYPLVRELAADGIPVAVMCRVLKIALQPYYRRPLGASSELASGGSPSQEPTCFPRTAPPGTVQVWLYGHMADDRSEYGYRSAADFFRAPTLVDMVAQVELGP